MLLFGCCDCEQGATELSSRVIYKQGIRRDRRRREDEARQWHEDEYGMEAWEVRGMARCHAAAADSSRGGILVGGGAKRGSKQHSGALPLVNQELIRLSMNSDWMKVDKRCRHCGSGIWLWTLRAVPLPRQAIDLRDRSSCNFMSIIH